MVHRISISIVIAYVILALLWDGLMAALGIRHESFCDAAAAVNAWTEGLMACCLPGLYLHIFGQHWLPASWKSK